MDVNIQKSGVVNYTADLGVFEAITSTTTGEIATFESNVLDAPCPSVLCTINPVQDLHGQDYPYPSGGGKNILEPIAVDITSNNVRIIGDSDGKVTISGTASADTQIQIYSFVVSTPNVYTLILKDNISGSNDTYWLSMSGVGVITSGKRSTFSFANTGTFKLRINVKSGAVTNFTVYPMVAKGNVDIPYAPYSNICPITGHTELNLVHTGKNLWDEVWEVGTLNPNTGAEETSTTAIRSKNYSPCIPNTVYYKYIGGNKNGQLFFYDDNKNYISRTGNSVSGTFITPSNACYMKFASYGDYGTTYKNDISINYPSTDTSYHAYNGTNTTITFPDTVYGASLDVGSGVLTIDRAIVTLDGTTNWISDTASNFRYFDSEMTALNTTAWETNVLSNLFAKQGTFPYCQINGARKVRVVFSINDTSVTTVAQLQALLTQTNLQVVYPLATPTTTQLTPEQLNSILGDNNIYHDGNGQVAVTYLTIRSYSLDGFFENNPDRLSISQTFINSTDFIEI